MNTPYLWFTPNSFPEQITPDYNVENSPDRFIYSDGELLKDAGLPLFKVKTSRSRLISYDVIPNGARVPLISPRVASLLTEICPNDVQLISARIQTRDIPIDEYFLLNVTSKISGIDHSNSSFSMIPGTQSIMSMKRLRYAFGAMGDHHLAREKEYLPFIWVSSKIVQRFEREKIKGCEFLPPEAIHP